MRTLRRPFLAALAMLTCASACAAEPVVLDAKAFTLAKATLAPIPNSDKRGILFGADDATATASVKLAPGKYQVVVHLYAENDDQDALFVVIGGEEFRIYANEKTQVGIHSRAGIEEGTPHELPLTVAGAQPATIVLKTAETGVIVERVEIAPAPAAPAPAPQK